MIDINQNGLRLSLFGESLGFDPILNWMSSRKLI